jgi:hypothetical protein
LIYKRSELRCYDYVNRPYERVRDELKQNALTVFQAATKATAARAQSIAAELHVDFRGIALKTDINEEALWQDSPDGNCVATSVQIGA